MPTDTPRTEGLETAFGMTLSQWLSAPRWYVAYSGGLDSTVLLHLLSRYVTTHEHAPELLAWHINHNLQAAAGEFESHCRAYCESHAIALRVGQVAVGSLGDGVEAAARKARYDAFEQGMEAGSVLLLGHHLDDQIETFFLRLLRGAGLKGLSAMPATRALGQGALARPLLAVPRAQLQHYAEQWQLPYIDDPTNADPAFDRNYLRAQVLPGIEQRWPGYRETVARAAGHIATGQSSLENHFSVPETVISRLGDPGVTLAALAASGPTGRVHYLRAWLGSYGVAMPDAHALQEFLRQLQQSDIAASPRLDAGDYVLQKFAEAIYLLPPAIEGGLPPNLTLSPGQHCTTAAVGALTLAPTDGPGIALAPGESLAVAWRAGGERCRPLGRAHSQTLKKLLQECAVPPWWRQRIPLLTLAGELVAVGDLWLCESPSVRSAGQGGEKRWKIHWQRNTFTAPIEL